MGKCRWWVGEAAVGREREQEEEVKKEGSGKNAGGWKELSRCGRKMQRKNR